MLKIVAISKIARFFSMELLRNTEILNPEARHRINANGNN